MGVFKLWQLLLTVAQPYDIEQLYGKIVAIDASIWIVKIDTIFGSNTQKIKSILSKVMLMKRNNILPIFVFDGIPPALKRKTLEERSRRRLIADNQQAKKKSQIQIMRMIQGDSSRQGEKNKRMQQNELQLQEVNTRLLRLSQFNNKQQAISKQYLQKIALQSQILSMKYKIMLDLLPQYRHYENYLAIEEYQQLDLQSKTQYLDELEEYKWKHLKRQRKKKNRQNMTQQQKLREDLEVIQKKSIIRQMQDNLFRKMLQKNMKIENGYEIIETIYNGKTVIQKRKIKQQNQCSKFGFGGLRKGKSKNDFSKLTFGEEKDSEAQAQVDPFVSSFCDHSAPSKTNSNTRDISQSQSFSQEQQKKGPQNTKIDKQKEVRNIFGNNRIEKKQRVRKQSKKKHNQQRKQRADNFYSNNEQSSQPYLPFIDYNGRKDEEPELYVNREEFNQKFTQSQDQLMNKDNLPNFKSNQHPQYLNSSNDNLQLQNLFKILGLPYLVAPGEAQAQCAALQQQGIVDGVITEDSDIFLFGGKNVFRGLFNNNIRYYNFNTIQQKLRLNRQKLIIFAELLGSDYTEGVKGIGLVNAMQILKVFNTFDKLQKFKQWASHPDVLLPEEQKTGELLKMANQEQKQFYQLHKRYKNYWYIGESFGNENVQNAYLKPNVVTKQQLQKLKEKGAFKEQQIKQSLLSKLLKQRLELQGKQYDHYLRLLTLKYNNKRQNTILNYFSRQDSKQEVQYARIKSRRLQKSLESQEND